MKLWELKANCLKIIFADSDMTFDEADFGIITEGDTQTIGDAPVYNEGNTRDYLSRITDSIRRAIDLIRATIGENKAIFKSKLYIAYYDENGDVVSSDSENAVTHERLNMVEIPELQALPVDTVKRVSVVSSKNPYKKDDNVSFSTIRMNVLGEVKRFITFDEDSDFSYLENLYDEPMWNFTVYYDVLTDTITTSTSDLFDLDTLDIPEYLQNVIPLYVKSEIYEEDEPELARVAKSDFNNALYLFKKNKTHSQKRVKTAPIFRKIN